MQSECFVREISALGPLHRGGPRVAGLKSNSPTSRAGGMAPCLFTPDLRTRPVLRRIGRPQSSQVPDVSLGGSRRDRRPRKPPMVPSAPVPNDDLTERPCEGCAQFVPGGQSELGERRVKMAFHRPHRERERVGDLHIGGSLRRQ
jgi:hypothetical protein